MVNNVDDFKGRIRNLLTVTAYDSGLRDAGIPPGPVRLFEMGITGLLRNH